MPRQARIDTAGALHHIIVRGIERKKIFADDQDRHAFIKRLGRIVEQTQTGCFAWSMMPPNSTWGLGHLAHQIASNRVFIPLDS